MEKISKPKKKPPLLATPHVFYVRPAPGWMDFCESEIRAILADPLHRYKFTPLVTAITGVIKVHRCDWRQGLELLLRLTTAHDVEWLLVDSACGSWDRLHKIVKGIAWDEIFAGERPTAHVSAKASSGFTSSSAKLREALVAAAGFSESDEDGDCRLKIDLYHEHVKVTLSLAGDPLYRRGYKAKMVATAPLAEHHAAACVRFALGGFGGDKPEIGDVFVPFAGSGTLGFETFIALADGGPGSFRRSFAADVLKCTPTATIEFLRRKLAERLVTATCPRTTFVEMNQDAMAALRANAEGFPAKARYEFIESDVFSLQDLKWVSAKPVLVLLNPPYGQRLAKTSDIVNLYRRLGKSVASWSAHHPTFGVCICPDEDTWKEFCRELRGMELSTRHFTHGGEDVRLVRWVSSGVNPI